MGTFTSLCVTRKRRCLFLDFLYSLKKVEIVNDNFGLRRGRMSWYSTYAFAMRLTESLFLDFLFYGKK